MASTPSSTHDLLETLIIAAGEGRVHILVAAIEQGIPEKIGPAGVAHVMASAVWGHHVRCAKAWLPVFSPSGDLSPYSDTKVNDSLQIASEKGFHDLVELLLPCYPKGEMLDMALYSAALKGHAQIAQTLLDAGANARAVRSSALVAATRQNHCAIVSLLAPLSCVPLALEQCLSMQSQGEGMQVLTAYHQANELASSTPLTSASPPKHRI